MVVNSSLGTPCGDLADFGHCADFSPVLRPKSAKNSTTSTANTRICDLKNVDSAYLQNLEEKSLSLRADSQNLRGNPPYEKTQKSQNGLPRSRSLARNDDSFSVSTILQNRFFPAKNTSRFAESSKKFLPNTALIALGANLKNPIHTFKSLFTKLARNAKIHILATSPIYKNPPFGFRNQPFFYNATALLATKMCLLEFYAFIFYLERIFGRTRKRAFKNAPRALDIDIIFFNDIFMRSAKLNIPHPHWRNRPSVVVPLLFQVNYKGF